MTMQWGCLQPRSGEGDVAMRRSGRMPKGIIYLESMPVSPDRVEDYHKWYNDTHLAEICSVDGIVSARRFAPSDGKGPFIAIYELDCDDLDSVVQRLGELGASGKMSSLELLNMETPPIPKVYGQIGSYTK
jgi:hypothetical protein